MLHKKKEHPKEKTALHPRNRHRERYNFEALVISCPALAPFVQLNPYGDASIDFFNPAAVKMLNKALLLHFYAIDDWDIPAGYLCPPIPGRADYVHYAADILAYSNLGEIPTGNAIHCLDIGVGANMVYPIIGHQEYGWGFVGSDIDAVSIASANAIVQNNPALQGNILLRLQTHTSAIFKGIIQARERFDITICNPPFHTSAEAAKAGSVRKLNNLQGKKNKQPILNFGGQNNELWCDGGEAKFIENMIMESAEFATSVCWFTTLVSKQEHLDGIYNTLKKVKAVDIKTIPMGQGNKISRLVAWTFLSKKEQAEWRGKDIVA